MAHTNSWDETQPTNNTNATDIDDHIRKVRLDVRERMAVDHKIASSDAGESQYGVHTKVTFEDPIAEPTLAAGESCLYPDSGDDAPELRYLDSRGVSNMISFVGEIRMRLGTSVPEGWLALNGDTIGNGASGATKAHADYEELFIYLWDNLADAEFAVSGGRGGSGAADFAASKTGTMPDSRARSPIGVGTDGVLTERTIGDVGGDETHTLITAEMPGHDHNVSNAGSAGAHVHNLTVYLSGSGGNYGTIKQNSNDGPAPTAGYISSSGAHTHTVTEDAVGGDGPHVNMHPWLAVAFLIKF